MTDYSTSGLEEFGPEQHPGDPHATALSLHENRLCRVDVSGFPNLRRLSLHNNRLTDASPVCHLLRLTWLSLHYNRLRELPPAIGNLRELRRLSLHNNELQALPDEFRQLSRLQVLSLFRNDLDTIQDDLFDDFTACTLLALHQNPRLRKLPASLCRMPSLAEVWIGQTAIPPEAARCIPRRVTVNT